MDFAAGSGLSSSTHKRSGRKLELKDQYGYTLLYHAAVSGICDILVFLINEAKYYKLNEEDGHRLFSVVPDTTIVIGINGVRDSARKFSSSMAQ